MTRKIRKVCYETIEKDGKLVCKYCHSIPIFGCVMCNRSPIFCIRQKLKEFISALSEEDEVYSSDNVKVMMEELWDYA